MIMDKNMFYKLNNIWYLLSSLLPFSSELVRSTHNVLWKMLWPPHSNRQPYRAQLGKMLISRFLCKECHLFVMEIRGLSIGIIMV